MKSLTKNSQTKETLETMITNAFPLKKCTEVTELTEGYFNVAYRVSFENGSRCILKIAPPEGVNIMSYEKNIMLSEVTAMQIVAEKTDVPVAKVLSYDDSCTICTSPYFFMEELQGDSVSSLQDRLQEDVKKQIRFDAGKLNRKINHITGDKFGYIGQPDLQGSHWYSVFFHMIELAVQDAKSMSVDLKISVSELFKYLTLSESYFEEVTTPRLVHWDLWDGNIFVKDHRITGLIDWERSLWADPFMEVGFRTYGSNDDFKNGYGMERLSQKESIRALWYDVYAMLLVAQECDYRMYETREIYNWSTGILVKKFDELKHRIQYLKS